MLFFQAEDGLRNAHLAVLVSGRFQHIEPGGQGLGDHFFRRGFPYAASDPPQWAAQTGFGNSPPFFEGQPGSRSPALQAAPAGEFHGR